MTKQSNKNKFLATAVTATMVATAFAPVASVAAAQTTFPDVDPNVVGQSSADAVAALAEAGIIKGIDGQFKPGASISRAEASQMVAKLFDLKTGEVKNETTFEDVKDNAWYTGAINSLVEKDILKGKSATSFEPGSDIKRSELALVLVKAYGLQDVNVDDVKLPYTDVKAGSWYEKSVKILYKEGLLKGTTATTFSPDSPMKRVDFARLAVETDYAHGTKLPKPTEAVAVESVKAINAKTIEVTFNTAVDTDKAKVELLRGTFKQNVTLTWSEDKTSVQLAGASNFQAAEYTVNVSGLTEEALSETIKIEAQKVASIEILDEVAVVDKAVDAATGLFSVGTKATVSYVVKDQYGTDITKTTDLTTNDTTQDPKINAVKAKGIIELSGNVVEGKKVNDLVPVVLIDSTTGTSVSKTVKLSSKSTVSAIDVAGVYNAKGEKVALNDNSKASDAYIVLDLKDQYGKAITETAQAAGLVITNTNTTNLTIPTTVSKVKIGDKDQLVVPISAILKAGNTDVLFISTTNGQSFKYTVEVAETATTDAISVSQPEIAVADETTLIPLTVTDKEGNVITDKKLLSNDKKGIKVGGVTVAESALEVKDGQVYYKSTFGTAGTQALVFQTSSYKVATITVDVKAKAVATVVRGLKNPLVISTKQDPVTITAAKHLVIEDQYGREMKGSTAPVTVTLVGTSDVVTLAGNQVTAAKNGTATLNIALVTPNGTISSDVEVKVQVTDGTEYSGYEIATIGKTQAGVAKDFTINGLLNNGKVALTADEYTATLSGGKISGSRAVTTPITVTSNELNVDDGVAIDTEFTLKVTINATGKVLEQKFVVSPDAPKVQEFFFTASAAASAYKDAKAITEATITGGSTVADLKSTGDTPATVNVATVDQYGNKAVTAITSPTVTIVPEKVADVVITGNGTADAKVALKNGVEGANVTYKVTIGGATQEIKVKVVTP